MTRPTTKAQLARQLADLFDREGLDYTLRRYTSIQGRNADELDPKLAVLWRMYLDVASAIEAHVGAGHYSVPEPTPEPWRIVLYHPEAYEGGWGLVIPSEGESYEDCLRRFELRLVGDDGKPCWRQVRVRRPQLDLAAMGGFSPIDYDLWVEHLDERLHQGDAPEGWQANWDEQLADGQDGAREAFDVHLEIWARRYVRVDAHELHPEDKV